MRIPEYAQQVRPTPDAEKMLIYKKDLQHAVDRLDNCWNKTQVKDVLNSMKHFMEVMEQQ